MEAQIPKKISSGRAVMIVTAKDPAYTRQTISESLKSEEEFNRFISSPVNQLKFISSLTQYFLRFIFYKKLI